MGKKSLSRFDAINLIGEFMLLDGFIDVDFFVCGSIRRWLREVGDADIIIIGDYPNSGPSEKYKETNGRKARTYNYKGMQINFWRTEPELLGAALLYATGSGPFNRKFRSMCMSKGLKLSQNGLVNRSSGKLLVGATEKAIFNYIGYKYIPPRFRRKTKLNPVFNAFIKRQSVDHSFVRPLLGRVQKLSLYSKAQKEFLPVNYPNLIDATETLNLAQILLADDKDA